MSEKVLTYLKTDKSSMNNLFAAALDNLNTFIETFDTIAAEAQLLAKIINTNLGQSISEAYFQRKLILIIFIISLFIIGTMIWIQILTRLKEVDNNLKNVLQVLPAELVLENFELKKFLFKTPNVDLEIFE